MKFNGDVRKTRMVEWSQSYYRFENGDGTMYEVHLCSCENGGTYMIEGNVQNNSLWIVFDNEPFNEIRHLAGPNNPFTAKAMIDIYEAHRERIQ
jgi:hypothetical protein